MLKSLRNYKDKDALGVLSEIADVLLPSPTPVDRPEWLSSAPSEPADVHRKVLDEARKTLKLGRSDQSPEATGKITEFIGRLMSAYALKDADTGVIKQRLGERGELPLGKYGITFSVRFFLDEEGVVITRSEAEALVRQPDDIQHLVSDKYGGFTLFVKFFDSDREGDSYFTLIIGVRKGAGVRLDKAWRVYPSEVDISGAREPLDILKAFLEVYGTPFTVGDNAERKFFLYEVIPVGPDGAEVKMFSGSTPPDAEGHFARGNVHMRYLPSEQILEVAMAYMVDLTKYMTDLRRHGLEVKVPTE